MAETDEAANSEQATESKEEPKASRHPAGDRLKQKGKGLMAKLAKNKTAWIVAALFLVVVAIIIILAIFLSLFKLNHIEKLFVDYQFAQFERNVAKQSREALKEAEGKAKGNSESTSSETDPIGEQIDSLNAPEIIEGGGGEARAKLNPDGTFEGVTDSAGAPVDITDPNAPADVVDSVTARTAPEQVEVTGGEVVTEYGLGTPDTPSVEEEGKSSDQVQEDTQKAAEQKARGTSEDIPGKELKQAEDQANQDIENGKSPEVAVENAADSAVSKLQPSAGDLLNSFAVATVACVFYDLIHGSVGKAIDKAVHGYMQIASTFYAAADKQKESKLSTDQLAAYNNFFDYTSPDGKTHESFTDSAAYLRATGQPDKVNTQEYTGDSNHPKPNPDFNDLPKSDRPFQDNIPTAIRVADALTNIPGLDKACGIVLNPVVQAAGIAASVALWIDNLSALIGNPEAAGSIAVTVAAPLIKAAIFVGGIEGAKYLVKMALNHYMGTNTAISPTSPKQNANKLDVGTDLHAQASGLNAGGRELSSQEVAAQDQILRNERIALDKRKGLAWRVFSLDNTHSMAFRLLFQAPSTPRTIIASLSRFTADMLTFKPIFNVGHQLAFSFSGAALADSGDDPYGIPHYGLTDGELDSDSILHLASIVEPKMKANPDKYKKYDQCFNSKLSDVHTKSDLAYCNKKDDPDFNQYRVYHFNRRVVHSLVLLGNKQASTKTAAASANNPGGVTPISASRQEMNQRLLSNPLFCGGNPQKNCPNAYHDIVSGIAQDNLVALLLAIVEQGKFPIQINVIKTGHDDCSVSGLTSNHYSGLAADIAGYNDPKTQALNKWLYDNAAALNVDELIHEPHPGISDLKHGQPFNYDSSVTSIHYNHIHVAANGPHQSAGCPNDPSRGRLQ